MKGKDLQHEIIKTGHRYEWRIGHFPAVKTVHGWRTPVAADGKGFPDLVLVRERVIWVEVKGTNDRLRPAQSLWLSALRLAGEEVYVWTPYEWEIGVIEDVLKTRRRRGESSPPLSELFDVVAS